MMMMMMMIDKFKIQAARRWRPLAGNTPPRVTLVLGLGQLVTLQKKCDGVGSAGRGQNHSFENDNDHGGNERSNVSTRHLDVICGSCRFSWYGRSRVERRSRRDIDIRAIVAATAATGCCWTGKWGKGLALVASLLFAPRHKITRRRQCGSAKKERPKLASISHAPAHVGTRVCVVSKKDAFCFLSSLVVGWRLLFSAGWLAAVFFLFSHTRHSSILPLQRQ
jgi:hypothetical protein